MWTDIYLINSPRQDSNYNHTPYFKSLTSQINWYASKRVYTIDNANYQRKNNNLKVNYHIDDVSIVNYVMVNNNDKWYFYFVMDKVYINERTTELVLRLDVMQTYLFDFNLGNCLIERTHTRRYASNGNALLEPMYIEENFASGEYIPVGSDYVYNYTGKGSYIITSSDLLGTLVGSGGDNPGDSSSIGEYPYNSAISESINNRFARIWQGVKEAQTHGLFPSVTYAQYVMEAGWNGSTLSETYNNAFGIKAGSSWAGETVELPTQEYINGEWINTTATWRVYNNINESVRDRTQFLLENSRYTEGGVFSASTFQEQCYALQNSGYATDPNYASLLISIIQDNNFTLYDGASNDGGTGVSIGYAIVNSALKLIGKPYRWGGNYPPLGAIYGNTSDGTDCSGLCQWAYNDAGANHLTTMEGRWVTYTMYPNSDSIELGSAEPGDVLFTSFSAPGVPEHVMLVKSVSGNQVSVVEAQYEGTYILERTLTFNSSTMEIRRLLR